MSAAMVVLFINRSDSRCGACDKTALLRDVAHTTPCGYDRHDGCGATFTHVSSDYMGDDMRSAAKRMRPDLPWLDYREAHERSQPVTAAERATVMAAQGAAEARAETADQMAGITQEMLDATIAARLTEVRMAIAKAEGARRAADAAQEAADDAERSIRDREANLSSLLDAAREKLPDLQVPTFKDAVADLEAYR